MRKHAKEHFYSKIFLYCRKIIYQYPKKMWSYSKSRGEYTFAKPNNDIRTLMLHSYECSHERRERAKQSTVEG
ncbi:hypothetical protein FACS189472_09820 [Alphaproteobacteria bacterium]|nr:hypothetical protein FACS189472_09820 [Alphaproteobacteria bacterium]